MNERLAQLFHDLPTYLGGHMLLSLSAISVGLLVSLPLGIAASRRPKMAQWTLGIAGVVQTVPSLALLALMVPLLGGLIGFPPAFIALTFYSVLPILANTVVGIKGVDPVLTEAALGLGMNQRQMLFRVQLPLAAPTIIAGVRTATVLVVGTATLVTPVGGVSLGNYIFGGLESLNHLSTVFGCVFAALLAIVLDQLIHVLEVAVRRRSPRLACIAAAGLMLVVAGGLYTPLRDLVTQAGQRPVISSGPFTEQHILNELLTLHLGQNQCLVDQRRGMSEGMQFEGLFHNQVDCMVNYSGNIWTLVMKRGDFTSREAVLAEITRYLRENYGVTCLGSLGFENAYAVVMPRQKTNQLNIHSVEALAEYLADPARRPARRLRIGGDSQFFHRPEWRRVKRLYALEDDDLETVAMDPTLMYGAVRDGQVDVIVAYTSDGRIPAYELEILSDPKAAFPPYDAVLLVSAEAAARPGFIQALRPLVGSVRLEAMQKANHRVDVEKWLARRAAEELLAAAGPGR